MEGNTNDVIPTADSRVPRNGYTYDNVQLDDDFDADLDSNLDVIVDDKPKSKYRRKKS